MPVINGNQHVKGIIDANSLLFKEILDSTSSTRGANIDLVNGRIYYKIDSNNTFEFVNKTELDDIIANLNITPSPSSASTTVTSVIDTFDLLNLVNVTFFSVNDSSVGYLINVNFDSSNDIVRAGFAFDKVLSSIYKNGTIQKYEYWTFPILSVNTFKNNDIISSFESVKFDNSAASVIDQSSLNSIFFSELMNLGSTDISSILDFLLIDNSSSGIIGYNAPTSLLTGLFGLSWVNHKIDLMMHRGFVSEFHKRVFNNESILYFMNNYLNLYKDGSMTRLKLYFFDYRFLIYSNIFHMIDYLKTVFISPTDYSNSLAQNILNQKSVNSDITTQSKDFTAFEWNMNADELIECIFDYDNVFKTKIDWSSLDIIVSSYKWNLMSLNDSQFNDLDLSGIQSFPYSGESTFKPVIDRMNISQGELWVPLFEVDFPLDSLFYFMM